MRGQVEWKRGQGSLVRLPCQLNENRGTTSMGDEIACQRAIGEGNDGWNTMRMNSMDDGNVTPACNGGEPLAAPQDLPPAKSSQVCAEGASPSSPPPPHDGGRTRRARDFGRRVTRSSRHRLSCFSALDLSPVSCLSSSHGWGLAHFDEGLPKISGSARH